MRVVSVLPSATEIVCALGHRRELVGRSAECDYPASVRRLPIIMRPRTLEDDQPSATIDARVREARGRGESLYYLDIDRLRELAPDLLLTQDLCEVCSVTTDEVAQACSRAGVAPNVLSLVPRRLDDVWESVESVGRALGDPDAGGRLARSARERAAPVPGARGLRVAVIEWLDPPILAGLWSSDMIAAAGGTSVGPGPESRAERATWSEIARRSPDLVVLTPCSFSVPRTLRELSDPRISDGVAQIAPELGVFVADEAYFSRPGPRLADGVRLLAELLAGKLRSTPMPVARWTAPISPAVHA